ncbi:hypothetical protein V500_06144 [Pseudogymnoascus sp. VKM F-4518 (FW-2643)]|nr:hypothetical protein V500_06144 [Pseudogymnoascus sp. VKM F-4518 (FW-2643)]
MPRGPELSVETRVRILELHDIGWSLQKIATKHSLTKATVQSTISRARERERVTGGQASLPRKGAPRVITEDERDAIIETTMRNPYVTHKELRRKRGWVFAQAGKERLERGLVELRRCGKAKSKMFWAAFSHGVRTYLILLEGDLLARRGGVTARVYRAVLDTHLLPILDPRAIFMHDNAPIHTAGIIEDWLREHGINVMDWLLYSLDLNPIENLWALLKLEVYKLHPYLLHAPNNVETLYQLIWAAMVAWEQMGEALLLKLLDSIVDRRDAIIAADGWVTILEATAELQSIGGVISLGPNTHHVLEGYGVYEEFIATCSLPLKETTTWRYNNDAEILSFRAAEDMEKIYGYPWLTVHRADVQGILASAARRRGVEIRLKSPVKEINHEQPAVILETGDHIKADLIIGADGIRSAVRKGLGSKELELESGLHICRILLPEETMKSKPDIYHLIERHDVWLGPGRVVVATLARQGDSRGAAMSIEDGACLSECLNRASSKEDISKCLDAFEKIRKPRVLLISTFGDKRSKEWMSKNKTEVKHRDENLGSDWKARDVWDGKHIDRIPDTVDDPL